MDHTDFQANGSEATTPGSEGVFDNAPASYNSRFGAFILDLLFYVVFVYSIGTVLNFCGVDRAEEWAFYVIAPVPFWVGFVALGVTPASWLCDIRIVDRCGRVPGLCRAVRRSLIPGTVWAFAVPGFALFDQRIDSFFEANTGILGFPLFSAFVVLMCFFFSYLRKADRDELSTAWHDEIAGTGVIEYRSERKAAIEREIKEFRKSLSRIFTLLRRPDRSNSEAGHANRADEEV